MPIIIMCPGCSTKLKVGDNLAGRRVKCPKCSEAVSVMARADEAVTTKPAKRRDDEGITTKPAKRGNGQAAAPEKKPKQVAKEAVGYQFEETETPPPEDRPRKKKRKKKRRREPEPTEMASWLKWLIAVACLYFVVAMFGVVMVIAGHGALVAGAGAYLIVTVPFSIVIMIIAMFASSALGGGIYFGEAGEVIIKSLGLLLIINLVGLIPFVGRWIVFLVWLIGAMSLFDIDIWEARFFIAINYMLNFLVNVFLVAIILSSFNHRHDTDDDGKNQAVPQAPADLEDQDPDFRAPTMPGNNIPGNNIPGKLKR